MPKVIRSFLENDAEKLKEIRTSQNALRSFDAARDIAEYVANLAEHQNYYI